MFRIGDSYRVPGKVRASWVLLIINFLAFYVTFFSFPLPPSVTFFIGGVIPAELFSSSLVQERAAQLALMTGYGGTELLNARPSILITLIWAMFLHGGVFHLLSNMFFLYLLAPNLEAQMGWKRFLLFYFSCGAVGTLCQIVYETHSTASIIGASGAISGLLGGYLVLFPDHFIRVTIGKYHSRNYRDFVIPFKALLAMWFISQLFGFIFPSPGVDSVAFMTHFGGFLCGLLVAQGRGGTGLGRRRFRVFKGGKDNKRPTWPPWGESG
ncbi:Rhomboid family intramembrane serine protease [Sulfidibacter corallicola]|uniref:Rhomboid family intramembrane serine protease n=1 Tax=Sulfidibacter corallicola TaxID=2818388 RepID=A0A8A4TXF8_SULCO|nr:rhomboid family intramembrane serine protease [Sulfidibacter corallicola]QTD54017.1 rhomboid family intramembrane serine protease [Sulfidibacter corallicola]